MENTTETKRRRLNLFDIIFIVIVLVAGFLVIRFLGGTGSSAVIIGGAQETVVYTIELNDMIAETAYLIKPGDALVDKVEKRQMGTVLSVEVIPATRLEKNNVTGERVIEDYPDRYNAIVTVTANATVTDSQISVVGGYIVRAGVRVSVNGPLYHSGGFIIDVERSDAP